MKKNQINKEDNKFRLENKEICETEMREIVSDFLFNRDDSYYDVGAIIEEQDVFFDIEKMDGCLEYKVIDTINKVMESGIKPNLIFIEDKTIQVSWGITANEIVTYSRLEHMKIRCEFIEFVSKINLPIESFKEAEEFQAESLEKEIKNPSFAKRLFDSRYIQVYFLVENFKNKESIKSMLKNIFIANGMEFEFD